MNIRPATADDVVALVALERVLFGADAWSEASVAGSLGGTWVCPEGYVVLGLAGEVADLLRIGVRPEARRHGTGRALLDHAVDVATVAGAARMLIEVSAANATALAFYAAAGFTPIDRRRRYYRDGTDAVVLARSLAR